MIDVFENLAMSLLLDRAKKFKGTFIREEYVTMDYFENLFPDTGSKALQ